MWWYTIERVEFRPHRRSMGKGRGGGAGHYAIVAVHHTHAHVHTWCIWYMQFFVFTSVIEAHYIEWQAHTNLVWRVHGADSLTHVNRENANNANANKINIFKNVISNLVGCNWGEAVRSSSQIGTCMRWCIYNGFMNGHGLPQFFLSFRFPFPVRIICWVIYQFSCCLNMHLRLISIAHLLTAPMPTSCAQPSISVMPQCARAIVKRGSVCLSRYHGQIDGIKLYIHIGKHTVNRNLMVSNARQQSIFTIR